MRPEPFPQSDSPPMAPLTEEIEAVRLRSDMVARLKASSAVRDPTIEQALQRAPRHLFLPGRSLDEAYENVAVATRWERGAAVSSVSQPEMVALMLEQLQVKPGMRVLEIGAGAGYNAALLAELTGPTGSVVTVEIDTELAAGAATHLAAAGYSPARARVVAGDGWRGWPDGAPYDRIEITASVWDLSPAWFDQLAEGGLLLAPLWLGATDVSVALRKRDGALASESWALCGFVRLRGDGAGHAPVVRLPDGSAIAGPNADILATDVAQTLAMRSRRADWTSPGPGFLPYLALVSGGLLALWQTGWRHVGRYRPRYALYREGPDGPSLVIFPERAATLLSFGGTSAEQWVREQAEAYRQSGMPPADHWRLIAWPRPHHAPPAPSATRLYAPHWLYDIQTSA